MENTKEAYTWWFSLSINEMKQARDKFMPNWSLDYIEQIPWRIIELYEKST